MSQELDSTATVSNKNSGDYVVVARRYRPMSFEELIGQGHVAKALGNAISSNRVGHAYLFTGARGVGKTSAARILAKALDCSEGPTPTPCNRCEICQSIGRGDDVDVLEIDGASNRGIDEIRQLRQNAGVRPSRARFKIYIIDEVHMLTKEAFNALLKTLEEPPEHVKFIFATTEANKIPITILSRCQRFDFAGIDAGAIEVRLGQIAAAEGVAAHDEALQLLARRAGGSMRDSQSLLEQLLSLGKKTISADDVNTLLGTAPASRLTSLVQHLAQRNAAAALSELDSGLSQGVDVGQLLDQLLGYFRDCMAAAVGCSPKLFLHTTPAQTGEVTTLGKQFGIETILAIVQILEQAASRMKSSTYARTLAEMALVRICKLEDLDEIPSLIEALGAASGVYSAPGNSAAGTEAGHLKKNNVAPVTGSPVTSPSASSSPSSPIAQTPVPASGGVGAQPSTPGVSNEPQSPAFRKIAYQGPLNADSASAIWRHVLENLEEMVAVQADFSDRVTVSAPNRLAVSFRAKYTSCKEFCELPEQKAKLEQALGLATREVVRLEFQLVADPVEPTPVAAAPRINLRQYQAEVADRKFVRRAKELFGAEQVRVDPPENK